MKLLALSIFLLLPGVFTSCSNEEKIISKKVYVKNSGDRYELIKDGQPFFIKGAAGFDQMHELKVAGGNTIRTWSLDNADSILDEAYKNNLMLILGIYLPVERHGFDYGNTKEVEKIYYDIRKKVQKYKKHPALLMWGIGNEVDIISPKANSKNLKVWEFVNTIGKMIHEVDPDHPTTTMIVPYRSTILNIKRKCPEIDILSINTFGNLNELSRRLNEPIWGWDGPYLISEWGTLGWWEVEKTIWDAPVEATTSKKAEFYYNNYANILSDSEKCIGGCVFFWGYKQEKTPTWFSMFSKQGKPTEAIATMKKLWTNKNETNLFPQIEYMLVENKGAKDDIFLSANKIVSAEVFYNESNYEKVSIHWEILPDLLEEKGGGDKEKEVRPIEGLIIENNKKRITFKCPAKEGAYRIYVTITDPSGKAAITNTPIFIIE